MFDLRLCLTAMSNIREEQPRLSTRATSMWRPIWPVLLFTSVLAVAQSAELPALRILATPAPIYSHWVPMTNIAQELAARGHNLKVSCRLLLPSGYSLTSSTITNNDSDMVRSCSSCMPLTRRTARTSFGSQVRHGSAFQTRARQTSSRYTLQQQLH